jgi:hypothetical protein
MAAEKPVQELLRAELVAATGERGRPGSQPRRISAQRDICFNSAVPMHWGALRAEIPHCGTVRSRRGLHRAAGAIAMRTVSNALIPIRTHALRAGDGLAVRLRPRAAAQPRQF